MNFAPPISTSTPSFSEFDPTPIPWQRDLINGVFHDFDYALGTHEILLSGSVGSGKSLPAAHCALRHLLSFPKSRCVLARRAMPDLRDTIFTKLVEHLEGTVKADGKLFREGYDFGLSNHNCKMWFANGSEVISRSWADKNYKKLGSVEASIALVEELTENRGEDEMAIRYLRMRVGRLPHVPQQWIIYATNPDSPSHFAYDYFQIGQRQSGKTEGLNPTRHVYFSLTEDNPFLPPWYVEQLKEDLDPKLALRMLRGQWVEIASDVVYHAYSEEKNFSAEAYVVDERKPVYINWDFNIGEGKPLSLCLSQVDIKSDQVERFHFFAEVIIQGASTEDACNELADRGLLNYRTRYVVHGDSTGGSKSTKSKSSDYDIIRKFLANYKNSHGEQLDFEMDVPASNPPVRTRHNLMNAYCRNDAGRSRLTVYKGCPTLNKGMKLTALKKGGQYIEDDSKEYQHVTTAAGYHVARVHRRIQDTRRFVGAVRIR